MTPEQIYDYVNERAEVPDTKTAYWLSRYNLDFDFDDGEDYCRECISTLPALPGLVFCHLLSLLGVDVTTPQPHEWREREQESYNWRSCKHCDEYLVRHDGVEAVQGWGPRKGACLSWPKRIMALAKAARDGGWSIERDSWVTCAGCGADLEFCPTSCFVDEELSHFEEYGPPTTGREWWEISVCIDAMVSYYSPDAAKDEQWVRLIALMEKWGAPAPGEPAPPKGENDGR